MPSERNRVAWAYRALGLTAGASEETIRATYIALVKKYHPDAGAIPHKSSEKLKHINVAFQVLRDADVRGRYDAKIARKKQKVRRRLLPSADRESRTFLWSRGFAVAGLVGILTAFPFADLIQVEQKQPVQQQTSISPSIEPKTIQDKVAPGKSSAIRNWRRPPVSDIRPQELRQTIGANPGNMSPLHHPSQMRHVSLGREPEKGVRKAELGGKYEPKTQGVKRSEETKSAAKDADILAGGF